MRAGHRAEGCEPSRFVGDESKPVSSPATWDSVASISGIFWPCQGLTMRPTRPTRPKAWFLMRRCVSPGPGVEHVEPEGNVVIFCGLSGKQAENKEGEAERNRREKRERESEHSHSDVTVAVMWLYSCCS